MMMFMNVNCAIAKKHKEKVTKGVYNGKYVNYADLLTGYDKWEGFNRKMFKFNLELNRYLLRPMCVVWASVMPQAVITGIDNAYTNINYPCRLISSLLEKDTESAKIETKRFFINLTMGVGGLWDVATTKKHIEKRDEDMGQVLAKWNVHSGPYLVLPFLAQGKNLREFGGYVLNKPMQPTSYLFGWGSLISTAVSILNTSTIIQPITVLADTYADPYEVSRQLFGLDSYLKISNLDRQSLFNKKVEEQKDLINVNYTPIQAVKPDVTLDDYHAQGAYTDSVRTLVFDNKKTEKTIWSDLSIWNKTFIKKLKISTVRPYKDREKYKFKYVLQKNKKAPLAIIYPPVGESIWAAQGFEQGKMMYDRGYSVVILSSAFNWEFVESMPKDFRPGLPMNDAKYLREVTSQIITKLEKKQRHKFNKKILAGTSFGGIETLFVGALEEQDHKLGISEYIAVNPPIDAFFAMQQIDKIAEANKQSDVNQKDEVAVITQKVLNVVAQSENGTFENDEKLPFTQREAQIATGYSLRQKLSDIIFAIERKNISKDDIYKKVDDINYNDYAMQYLLPTQNKSVDDLEHDASLYAIEDFLKNNKNYIIFHTADDMFATKEQLQWLKDTTGDKTVIFSNGSHLGYLYRTEFLERFAKKLEELKTLD